MSGKLSPAPTPEIVRERVRQMFGITFTCSASERMQAIGGHPGMLLVDFRMSVKELDQSREPWLPIVLRVMYMISGDKLLTREFSYADERGSYTVTMGKCPKVGYTFEAEITDHSRARTTVRSVSRISATECTVSVGVDGGAPDTLCSLSVQKCMCNESAMYCPKDMVQIGVNFKFTGDELAVVGPWIDTLECAEQYRPIARERK